MADTSSRVDNVTSATKIINLSKYTEIKGNSTLQNFKLKFKYSVLEFDVHEHVVRSNIV